MSKNTKSILEQYTDTIKDSITILAGIVGIGYAVGFMIVNSYLMGWGIIDISLVKARYVSVGFLFMVHISLILVPSAIATTYFVKKLNVTGKPPNIFTKEGAKKIIKYLLIVLLILLLKKFV